MTPRVVALQRPARVSGVSTAGVHASRLREPFSAWRPLIVGSDLTRNEVAQSALAGAPGLEVCSWPGGTDPVEQVLHVQRMLRTLGVGVVVPNDLPHGFIASALDHHRGVRCAAWLHSASHDGEELVTHCFELADAWRAVSRGGLDRAGRTAAEVSLSISPSGDPAPAFIEVQPAPVPLPSLQPALRLLYAGCLEKHHKRVLDLGSLCDAMQVPFHLTIAGEGSAENELRIRLSPHIAAGRVTMLGAVPPASMGSLFDTHHALLLVSGSEAAPMCIMEAMARGRPVGITASCGEAAQWVRDGVEGVVVPTGDMAVLAAGLSRLASDSDQLATMGRAAWARAAALFSATARAPALQSMITQAYNAPMRLRSDDDIHTHWLRILHAFHAIGPVSAGRAKALGSAWLADLGKTGISTDGIELPLSIERREGPGERRLRRVVEALRMQGVHRLALYGGGRHTRRIARALEQTPEIVAIIDDLAGQAHGPPDSLAGKPVVSPREYARLGVGALIISSDEHEREMMVQGRKFAARVVPLYEAA